MRFVLLGLFVSSAVFAAKPTTMQKAFPEGEKLIFSKLVSSYNKRDLVDVIEQEKALAKNFPNSVQRDNAVYLMGYLELQKGRYAEALKAFGKLDDKRPYSIKRPPALFAMGVTYKKLDLPRQADSVFSRLIQSYPGSPEAKRAVLEKKLLRAKK